VKGTLYLYFATKEELFLELLRQELHSWFWDLETGVDDLPNRGRLEAFARLLARSAGARPNLRKLLVLLHANLLANLPESTLQTFRDEWKRRVASMGLVFERSLPFLQAGEGVPLVRRVIALILGLEALAEPLEGQGQAASPSNVGPDLQVAVTALMRGLRVSSRVGAPGPG
jgi:AcrR family transcriptional regulator